MPKPWSSVVESQEYQSLPPENREMVRQQYFANVVAPRVDPDHLDFARQQFDADTAPPAQDQTQTQAPATADATKPPAPFGVVTPEMANSVDPREAQAMGASSSYPADTRTFRDRLTDFVSGVFGGKQDAQAARELEQNDPYGVEHPSNAGRQFVAGVGTGATAGLVETGEPPPEGTAQNIANGLGKLTGFIAGLPVAAGEAIAAKTFAKILAPVATDGAAAAIAKGVALDSAKLATMFTVSESGKAIDQNTVGKAVKVLGEAAKQGAEVGASFSGVGRILPGTALWERAARIGTISAFVDLANGTTPWDERDLAQKAFDYGMNVFFSWTGTRTPYKRPEPNLNTIDMNAPRLAQDVAGTDYTVTPDGLKPAGSPEANAATDEAAAQSVVNAPDIDTAIKTASDAAGDDTAQEMRALFQDYRLTPVSRRPQNAENPTAVPEQPATQVSPGTFAPASEAPARSVFGQTLPEAPQGAQSLAPPTDTAAIIPAQSNERGVPQAEESGVPVAWERRLDAGQRQRVADMTPDEMRISLLTDHLTGIPNSRAYDEAERLPVQSRVDLDGFKAINDNYGHPSGDEVLKTVAHYLDKNKGPGRVYRIGGDEFPGEFHSDIDARAAMEATRQDLAKHRFTFELPDGSQKTFTGVGFSYGIGQTEDAAETALRADKAKRAAEGLRSSNRAPAAGDAGVAEGKQDTAVAEEAVANAQSDAVSKTDSTLEAGKPSVSSVRQTDTEKGERTSEPHGQDLGVEVAKEVTQTPPNETKAPPSEGLGVSAPKKGPLTSDSVLSEITAAGQDGIAPRNATWRLMAKRLERQGKVQEADGKFVAKELGQRAAVPVAESQAHATTKIEDFGETIEGARKHYAEAYRDKMRDALEANIATEPLAKSWPEPDYQKFVDAGVDPWTVAFVHAARDEIPTKPQKSWKLAGWVESVRALREFSNSLLDGRITKEAVQNALSTDKFYRLREGITGRTELYQAVGHDQSLKGVRLSVGSYSMLDGIEYKPPKTIWSVEKKAASTAFSNWPTSLATGSTREEAIANFKKAMQSGTTTLDKPADKQVSFSIYSYRSGDKAGKFYIGKKVGKNFVDLESFDDVKAARKYLSENNDKLAEKLARMKDLPSERRENNDPRVGVDHRNGADVTSQQFGDTFGFRGVQFGNYVEAGKRQSDLNEAYDALMDMAGILDIQPKALSLNGELGLAFGARGHGATGYGKGKTPKAHYEPGQIVINLTKNKGAGSLAHEWWHALDNYFSRMRGDKGGFLTEGSRQNAEGVRPEMVGAFTRVMQTVNDSGLRQRSQSLDKTRTNPYWSTGREMTARSFESYVIEKLRDQGASNDYLANIVSKEYWDAAAALGMEKEGTYPYPEAAEIPAVRAAFDGFFSAVETKETDKGTALYSRSDKAAPSGLSASRASEILAIPLKRLSDTIPVEIVQSTHELPFDAPDDVRGAYHQGKVWLVSDNLSEANARRTLTHEVVGHLGLEQMLGADELKRLLRDVNLMKRAGNKAVQDAAAHVYDTHGKLDRDTEAKEIIAHMAERGIQNSLIRRIVAAIREFLARMGLWFDKGTAGIESLIARAARYVEGHEAETRSPEVSPAFARSGEPNSAAAKMRDIPETEPGQKHTEPTGVTYFHMGINPKEAIENLKHVPLVKSAVAAGDKLVMFASPMATMEATHEARAVAKDFANRLRYVEWRRSRFDDMLRARFTASELKDMWEAQAEESVLLQKGEDAQGKGLDRLAKKQRDAVNLINEYGHEVWEAAKEAGVVKGEGLPAYAPYMFVQVAEDGTVDRVRSGDEKRPLDQIGINLTTAGPKQRKHLTPEESEAAAKAKLGKNVEIVRDIRTLPLAIARLEKAVAGRKLIDAIKEQGKLMGDETVSEHEQPGFFTLDHPAFKSYKPRLAQDEKTGKWKMVEDENGNPIFDRVPLYVRQEFEGPLRAVLTKQQGEIEKALMMLKGKSMSVIMYSPMIHNAVEFGRALPLMKHKIITAYFVGNKIKNDPVVMQEAIETGGLVPIGHRFFNQDITGIAEGPDLKPGRSLTAKAAGYAIGLTNEGRREAVMRAIDTAGDFWHNTLLWDRVGDLQMGIYKYVLDQGLKKGLERSTAVRVAAHAANRYAGALPNEAMSRLVRNLTNLTFFSRTFTFGNLGVMKDVFNGLPQDVRGQIKRDAGQLQMEKARSMSRHKAIQAFLIDIALFYVVNSLLQDMLDYWLRDKDADSIVAGYGRRLNKWMRAVKDSPFGLIKFLAAMSSTSRNETGKEDRVLFGFDKNGREIYMRNPTGKLGEDFVGWLTSPLDMLDRKESTLVRPVTQSFSNDKGFGRRVYDPDDKSFTGMARAVGNIAQLFIESQLPMELMRGVHDMATGAGDQKVNALKVFGPMVGVTFSLGHPAGPEAGYIYTMQKRAEARQADVLPEANRLILNGKEDEARKLMEDVGMTPQQINSRVKFVNNPHISKSMLRKFNLNATDDQQEELENIRK